ncbi:hypothetical protein A9Q84_15175 [Halobacteriovorax marinus]|uniref:Uncharacterized protein n=1 Tax=Halobacteriovorax marinus TaxID=97084 RepID=A0A1Y5F599_9BACT|nr:hypothetical protein A9Q84_15175 [Halobacteriovorax marinus]
MNKKRLLFATVAGFVTVFIFEMLWHGFLMKGLYEQTVSVWRPQEESNIFIMMVSQGLFAFVTAVAYTKFAKHLKCRAGIQFGVLTGLIVAMPQLASHCYLPIPMTISLLWMLAALLRSVFASMVIATIYKFD